MAEETLKERVGKLETVNLETHRTLGEMDARTDVIAKQSDGLFRAFYGYDKTPGLLHDVLVLIEKMDDLKKMVWIVIGIVASLLIGGLYEVIVRAPIK